MSDAVEDETPKARTILLPFRRPLWQNLLVPVVGLVVMYGAYVLTIVATGNLDIVAEASTAAMEARQFARVVSGFVVAVYLALAMGFAYGWPMLNPLFVVLFPGILPGSMYVLFRGPVPEHLFTAGTYYGLHFADFEWYHDTTEVGIALAVGFIGTLLLVGRFYFTTADRLRAYLDRLPEF